MSKKRTENKEKSSNGYDETMPEKIHCKKCKTLMENGVCPKCGFHVYVPMDKKKQDKIKLILTVIAMAVLVAMVVGIQISKSL